MQAKLNYNSRLSYYHFDNNQRVKRLTVIK